MACPTRTFAPILYFLLAKTLLVSADYKNVYGNQLQSCSQNGMALTGYTRTGYCVDRNDDNGSHHICIDLSSTTGGNFCDVTGQSDWCSSEMACHEDLNEVCQVQHWCVCQWAFASYLEKSGGCDMIQDVVCEAINLEALYGYWSQHGTEKYDTALQCIIERCSVTSNIYKSRLGYYSSNGTRLVMVSLLLVIGGFIFWLARSGQYRWGIEESKLKQELVDVQESSYPSVADGKML